MVQSSLNLMCDLHEGCINVRPWPTAMNTKNWIKEPSYCILTHILTFERIISYEDLRWGKQLNGDINRKILKSCVFMKVKLQCLFRSYFGLKQQISTLCLP